MAIDKDEFIWEEEPTNDLLDEDLFEDFDDDDWDDYFDEEEEDDEE